MAKVPSYTKGLVLQRETSRLADPSRIKSAGDVSRGVAQGLTVAASISSKIEETNNLSAVNDAVIKKQKYLIESGHKDRLNRSSNPLGFAKDRELQDLEYDKVVLQSLPSDDAKKAYQNTAKNLNLRAYEDNYSWEVKSTANMFINKANDSVKDLEVLAYRGGDLDEIKRNIDATSVTLQNVLSPDELDKFNKQAEQSITLSYLKGSLADSPSITIDLLDSKSFDDILTPEQIDSLYSQARTKVNSAEELKKSDPYTYLAATGSAVPSLDLSSGESLSQSISDRDVFRKKINEVEGINVPLLSKAEVENIENFIEQSDTKQAVEFLSAFDYSLNDENLEEFSSLLFNGEKPHLGVVASLAFEDAKTAEYILDGAKRIEKKSIVLPSDSELLESFNKTLDGTTVSPSVNFNFFKAVKAYYANEAFYAKKFDGSFNESILNNAIEKVVGKVVDIGGSGGLFGLFGSNTKIISFRGDNGASLDEDELDDFYESLTNNQLRAVDHAIPMTYSGQEINIEDIYDSAKLITVGDGMYLPIMRDGTNPVSSKDGSVFVINLKSIYEQRLNK